MKYAKVKEAPGLVRDLTNNAILNTDGSRLQAYKKARNKQREVDAMAQDLNNLKSDVEEIKTQLKALLEKRQ